MKLSSKTPIDALLDGGLQTGLVTHLYGPAGSGKTTFALQAAISVALLGYDVLFFDAEETLQSNRLRQVLGREESINVLRRITVSQLSSFQDQRNQFLELMENGGEPWGLQSLKLVVVDTIAKHYRLEAAEHPQGKVFRRLAEEQLPALLGAARRTDIAVLILNQVSPDFSHAQDIRPAGGDAVSRVSKYEIRLETDRTTECTRWATIEKTPKPGQTGKRVRYAITSAGLAQPAMLD
jgi:DNA repair protein RadB